MLHKESGHFKSDVRDREREDGKQQRSQVSSEFTLWAYGWLLSLLRRCNVSTYFRFLSSHASLHLSFAALTRLPYSLSFPSTNPSFLSTPPPSPFLNPTAPSNPYHPSSIPPPSLVSPAWFRPLAWEEHQSTMG